MWWEPQQSLGIKGERAESLRALSPMENLASEEAVTLGKTQVLCGLVTAPRRDIQSLLDQRQRAALQEGLWNA